MLSYSNYLRNFLVVFGPVFCTVLPLLEACDGEANGRSGRLLLTDADRALLTIGGEMLFDFEAAVSLVFLFLFLLLVEAG